MSYVTPAAASAELQGVKAWFDASLEEQTEALALATRAVDTLVWRGRVTDPNQPWAWPREGVSYWDDSRGVTVEVDSNTVPPRVVRAVASLAAHFLQYPASLQPYDAAFTSISVGPISLSASSERSLRVPKVPGTVKQLLTPFLNNSGQGVWWRAN